MAGAIRQFDTVAVRADLPGLGLTPGEVGAVVEDFGGGAFEVEFCGPDGVTYGLHTLRAEQLMLLHVRGVAWLPQPAAA
jgi:hypothetical protein